MKKYVLFFALLANIALTGCFGNSSDGPLSVQEKAIEPAGKNTFGVSGLLFENNLIMWFRGNNSRQSELFPQMYFSRADLLDFPVWGSFPTDKIVSGGLPRDGIPSLQNPTFVSPAAISEIRYLRDSDLVLGVVINGEVKAYPENILWWHEIANDQIGGVDVIMTLCPLTGTGMLFRMPEDGNAIDKLELLPVIETTWAKWKELYPQTTVISSNTGFTRDYASYPYGRYREENTNPLFPLQTGTIDGRFPAKHTVLGLLVDDTQKAYPFSRLEGNPVVNDDVNGKAVLIVSDISARLAIPYERVVNGRLLSFTQSNNNPFEMKDNETGSTWDIKGKALSGPLAGLQLTQIPAYNSFWFAWAVIWPETQVFGE
jgi:hypothetical protein